MGASSPAEQAEEQPTTAHPDPPESPHTPGTDPIPLTGSEQPADSGSTLTDGDTEPTLGGETETSPARGSEATGDASRQGSVSAPADSDESTDTEPAESVEATESAELTEEQPKKDADASTAPGETAPGSSPAETSEATTSRTGEDTTRDAGRPARGETTGQQAIPEPPELHSGHKLNRRYRLEECLTRLDGFSSWRAVDEKLRRAVGIHLLSAKHPRARGVLSAARSTALLGDPRFVQVLDAVEENGLVQIVHEWLPDATPLSELLAEGPLPSHEAYQLVSQLSQALSAAHREGLAHLRLNPTTVLRTGMGQYRVRGLAVNAALRGVTSEDPSRVDTEAIGALLYAALTTRWPYDEDAYGLPGVGTLAKGTLVAPEQVRAGVHRGLSDLAMRALINEGATASRHEQPCATPEELAKAVSAIPRIRPPEPAYTAPPPYHRTTFQQGAYGPGGAPTAPHGTAPHHGGEPTAPPTLPGRTGRILKWGVSALLIVALGLGSWQIADALLKGDSQPEKPGPTQGKGEAPKGKPVKIAGVKDFDPEGSDGGENPEGVGDAIDGKSDTYWLTSKYYGQPNFGNLKSGVGLILDLGKLQKVSEVKVTFMGRTSADLRAAPESATGMPTSLSGFSKVTSGSGERVSLKPKKPVKTQYALVWLTKLPLTENGDYRGRITQIEVSS
ncbi:hypothetical protein [Streptomyces sp. AJS327]|uniref:protein kinase family protein n=1 Tax=Streptomyces sp. AJS327 TaxID=2545265 RepID=UPI0035B4FCF6